MSNYVVSISREFGSGGRLIGKKLAASLGIPCYDRTLIQKTAEKSGLSPDFIARAEERARSRFHLNIAPIGIGVPTFTHQGIPVSHQAFFAQADVIRELAAEGPCVIVGRCSALHSGGRPRLHQSLYPCRHGQPDRPLCGGVSHPLRQHGEPDHPDGPGPRQLL